MLRQLRTLLNIHLTFSESWTCAHVCMCYCVYVTVPKQVFNKCSVLRTQEGQTL